MDGSDESSCEDTYTDCRKTPEISGCEFKSSESASASTSENDNYSSINGLPVLEFKSIEESKENLKKIKEIKTVLLKKPVSLKKLRLLAVSDGGLINDQLRKNAWPELMELGDVEVPQLPDESNFQNHPEYQQVVLDVNRSLRRFPPGIPLEQRVALQNQLTLLIIRVMTVHPKLKYYQGYHDVAVTLLLVTGIDVAYGILEKLSNNHLKDCMEPTMEKTSHLLNYIYPLVKLQDKEVYEYLEQSGVGTMFALPWFLTWFGHSLNNYRDVVRLFDYFLASEPLSPLYLSAVIIVYRSKEILNTPCDMANLHSLLSQIPDDLPFEKLLSKTTHLYKKHPPEEIQKEALRRTKEEEEQRKREYAIRAYRRNQNLPFLWRIVGHVDPQRRLPIWAFVGQNRLPHNLRQYKYLVATATFAFGLYAVYLKSVEATEMHEDG
ncbi:hypothetical protein RUM44_007141 [Polyplax serrata]|uniref:Rab-GAP TBC domain-containing protein n=1 Tax=Polyplax serrata TaxID=468196 RepID=A0ABR1AZV5_POLSC